MKDLQVGRQVPPQELKNLMPLSEVPAEPATIEQATEQGARDATLYFAELSQVAHQQRSSEPLESIDWSLCRNCSELMDTLDNAAPDYSVYWENPSLLLAEIEKYPDAYPFYRAQVNMQWQRIVAVDLDSGKIREIEETPENNLHYGVTFYDGRWRPVYMNAAKGPNDE